TDVTVVARAFKSNSEVLNKNGSGVVHLIRGKYADLNIDLNGPNCATTEICGNSVDENCNDVIDEGCCASGPWTYERVDNVSSGTQASIALLDDKTPAIAYHDGQDLRYAKRSGGGWKVTRISTPAIDGILPKLVFDTIGNPHIMSLQDDLTDGKALRHTF